MKIALLQILPTGSLNGNREKGVEVRQYPLKCYEACGIIRVMDNV